ncbi:hypothetical protein FI667_g13993, partial [Globisporangium splendens]
MGKTPEKVYSSVGVLPFGMRYRRKVPVADNNNNNNSSNEHSDDDPATPAATVVKQQPKAKAKPLKAKRAVVAGASENRDTSNTNSKERANKDVVAGEAGDNQLEHRDVDPVDAVDTSAVVVKGKSQRHADASSRLPEGASYTRKKKHKAAANELPHRSGKKLTKNKSEKMHKETPAAGESETGPATTVCSDNAQEATPASPVEVAKTPSVEASEKQVTVAGKDAVDLPITPKAKRQNKTKHRHQVRDRELAGSDRSSERSDSVATESVHPVAAVSNLMTKIKQPTEPIDCPKTGVSESKPQQQTHMRKQRKDAAFELRRRKQTVNNNNNRKASPSLMKQLLWKVKPVATSAPAQTTPVLTVVNEQTESSQNTNEEDDELAYTREERHSLKAHANSATKTKTSPSCLVVESSSQETQSGSDDEAFGLQYSLISGDNAIASRNVLASSSELELADVNFPTSLPLDKIESLTSSDAKLKVHEVLLEDFVFKPAELFIQKGDVVVWRVSKSTLGMVEHSLDATQFDRSGTLVRKVSTPLLGAGSRFAWRFNVAGHITIHCSVYNINGVIHVSESDVSVKEQEKANAPAKMTASQRRKKKMAAKVKKLSKIAEKPSSDAELDTRSDHSEDVVVFHPSKGLSRVPEMDAGVCRAVLSQLEEVQTAAAAAFIVVGDIACPLVAESTEEDTTAVEVRPIEADTLTDGENDEVSDFQQRIIAMLQKSEAAQARHRSSFVLSCSGFDAGAAYDFFKRRFAQAQYASESAVYARCPERQSSCGLVLSDLLSTLVETKGTK